MGITYKAFDTNLRVNVALKVINAKYLESEVAQQRFMREARAAAQLRHPNVASVFHLGTSRDAFFYAMEFVDGETVESFIKRNGPIDPVVALRITLQVTRALAAAAKHHLVHRDIKPANLMLVREDDDFLVKVIDFGLAKSIKHEENDDLATLSMGGFVGTAHFASPEQLEEKEIDVRSDIYSLGVTLWYMLAGQAPFGGSLAQVMSQHLHKPPPLEKLQNLPECVRTVVGHMIEKDPAKRPQTPAALRGELENCLALIEAAPPAGEQDFPTMVEATTVPRAVEPPPLSSRKSSRAIIWILGGDRTPCGWSAALLANASTCGTASSNPRPPLRRSHHHQQPAAMTPMVAQSTISPSIPSPSPAASSGEPAGLTREALAEAEKFEAAHDWPRAVMAYVKMAKKFPKSEVGRVRLELLLSKLQSEKGALRDENFDALRGTVNRSREARCRERDGNSRRRPAQARSESILRLALRGRGARAGARHGGSRFALFERCGGGARFCEGGAMVRAGAGAGDASAGTLLAECYLFGKGVTKNETKAVALLHDAAAANDPRAMDQLATCYHKGIGVGRRRPRGFPSLQRGGEAELSRFGRQPRGALPDERPNGSRKK